MRKLAALEKRIAFMEQTNDSGIRIFKYDPESELTPNEQLDQAKESEPNRWPNAGLVVLTCADRD